MTYTIVAEHPVRLVKHMDATYNVARQAAIDLAQEQHDSMWLIPNNLPACDWVMVAHWCNTDELQAQEYIDRIDVLLKQESEA